MASAQLSLIAESISISRFAIFERSSGAIPRARAGSKLFVRFVSHYCNSAARRCASGAPAGRKPVCLVDDIILAFN